MSRTRTQTRRRRGRRFRRRRNYRGRAVQPYKIVRNLKTVLFYPHDAGAGTISAGTMIINSANDPFGVFGSGQPLGHDQYSTLYEKCAVIGGKIFVECTSADGTNPVAVGGTITQSSTTLTTYEHYKELPHSAFRLMTPEQDKVTFGLRFGVGKYFGHRKILTDDRLSADIGSDPTDKLYCHLFAQAVDKAANPAVIHMVITVTQTVVYFKPKVPARS